MKKYILLTPGPVPLPQKVLAALAQPMEHHRTPEFSAIFARVLKQLKQVYGTSQPVFIHTSTGSGAMESALVNSLSAGDEVLCVVSGKFGQRWAEMAEAYGLHTHRLEVSWGQAVNPSEVKTLLNKYPQIKAVLCQACETSTGVLHPIQELAQVVAKTSAIFIVDAITALGAMPIPMDDWQIDVLIGGSQKAFMLPTGLSFISFSKKAWLLTESARLPKFYFDLRAEKTANDNGESLFSTPVAHIKALDVVLEMVLAMGLEKLYARIQMLSGATLAAAKEMGLESFANSPSPSLSTLKLPASIDGQKLRADIEKTSSVTLMGGQDQLKGKILRIGHMGAISNQDMHLTFDAIATGLNKMQAGLISEEQLQNAHTKLKQMLTQDMLIQ